MAINNCDPCSCIPANIANDAFKQRVMQILCTINSSINNEYTFSEIVVETGCLTQEGVSRQVEIVKLISQLGAVSVTYHEINGDLITTTSDDTIQLGDCYRQCATCRAAV